MYYCGIKPKASAMQPQVDAPTARTEMIVIHPPKSASPSTSFAKQEDSALIAQLSGKVPTEK